MPNNSTLLRVLITGRHWQKFETFEIQFRKAAAELATQHGERHLRSATVSRRQFERWYGGRVKTAPHPDACRVLEHMFGYPVQQLLASAEKAAAQPAVVTDSSLEPSNPHQIELLRHGLNDTLSEGTMAEGSLDDWERTVLRYGKATRDRPAAVLLSDLSSDLTELKNLMDRHRSASALRRLTRVTAHMSGLMCLTLVKLDDRAAFRRWARTARIAAAEAGDPLAHSWVLAQEAYGHYYSANYLEAIEVARHAQDLVHSIPCVGAALAAALEARAHAVLGRQDETRRALAQVEEILSRLSGDSLETSAFGYTEAQLRFHEGNAYTHLHDTQSAYRAQDRALELCAPGDYTDWAMTRLDRAICLVSDGDISGALAYATETLLDLDSSKRTGIITLRGHEILNALPSKQRELPAGRDFREVLMLTTERKEIEDS